MLCQAPIIKAGFALKIHPHCGAFLIRHLDNAFARVHQVANTQLNKTGAVASR